MLPDYCQTNIYHVHYFTTLLPATAFGIEDDLLIELCVDYGISEEKGCLVANVWAHPYRAPIKHLIYSLEIPEETAVNEDTDIRIFDALNNSEAFDEIMRSYILEAMEHREA